MGFEKKWLLVFSIMTVILLELRGVGSFLNLVAIQANGGKMPVVHELTVIMKQFSEPQRHSYPIVDGKVVRFSFLADRFVVSGHTTVGSYVQNRLLGRGAPPMDYLFLSIGDVILLTTNLLSVISADIGFWGFILLYSWKRFIQ